MEKAPRSSPLLPALVGLVPVVAYFSFLAVYAVNVPLFDDHALRGFLVFYQAADSFAEKFALVFSQHNEHRIGYDRLVVLMQFWLTGEINFVGMMVVGNLSLLGILWICYRIFEQTGRSLWGFVPVPYLLFSLALHENTFWGMAALQNFTVVFFVLLSTFHLTQSGTRALLWGCLSAVAAVYTSGNGFLLLPVGAGLLLLQRRWRDFVIFSSVAVVCVIVYFIGYLPPPGNPDQIPLTEVGRHFSGFVLFLGGAFQVGSGGQLSVLRLIGFLLTGYAVSFVLLTGWFYRQSLAQSNRRFSYLFLSGLFAFVLLTAALVTYSRLSFGEMVLLTSRYKIYSVLLTIGAYLGLLVTAKKPFSRLQTLFFVGATVVWNGWMFVTNLPEVAFHRKEMLTNLFNWTYSGNQVPATDGYDRQQHPYHRPLAFYSEPAPRWVAPIRPEPIRPTGRTRRPLRVEQTANELVVQDSVPVPTGTLDDGVYLLLKSPTRTFLFPTRPGTHTSLRQLLTTGSLHVDGYSAAIPKAEFQTDTYTLYLIRHEGGRNALIPTGERLQLVNPNREGVKTNW